MEPLGGGAPVVTGVVEAAPPPGGSQEAGPTPTSRLVPPQQLTWPAPDVPTDLEAFSAGFVGAGYFAAEPPPAARQPPALSPRLPPPPRGVSLGTAVAAALPAPPPGDAAAPAPASGATPAAAGPTPSDELELRRRADPAAGGDVTPESGGPARWIAPFVRQLYRFERGAGDFAAAFET